MFLTPGLECNRPNRPTYRTRGRMDTRHAHGTGSTAEAHKAAVAPLAPSKCIRAPWKVPRASAASSHARETLMLTSCVLSCTPGCMRVGADQTFTIFFRRKICGRERPKFARNLPIPVAKFASRARFSCVCAELAGSVSAVGAGLLRPSEQAATLAKVLQTLRVVVRKKETKFADARRRGHTVADGFAGAAHGGPEVRRGATPPCRPPPQSVLNP